MDNKYCSREVLKKFGMTMAVAFLVIAAVVFLRRRHAPLSLLVISGSFFVLGIALPAILKPVYAAWMKLAVILSWINTRIILLILFYLILTPIGLIMRVFGKGTLDFKIEKNRDSYWQKKEKKPFSTLDCQRQF
ncbi:MAG: SxtJ family membrane protein [Candidatus Omnitrophota bacterium]|nr:SxtJ family membrane protein [Candidatus Omnitrophota bacterium]